MWGLTRLTSLKRRIVYHNQLKRFYGTTGSQEETVQSKKISRQPVVNDGNTVESGNDVVIVIVVDALMNNEPLMDKRYNRYKTKLNLWCWSLKEDLNDNDTDR